jgi:hypothetical protein
MEAYLRKVAIADRDTVKKYLLGMSDDNFDPDLHPDYSSLGDAHGVWYEAKQFFAKELANKFYTGEKS